MIPRHIIQQLDLTNLPYIDVYGGLADTFLIEPDTPLAANKRFPVACEVTGNCNTDHKDYFDLTPDSARLSTSFWSIIENFTFKDSDKIPAQKYRIKEGSGKLRFHFIANQRKLGQEKCGTAPEIIFDFVKRLDKLIFSTGKQMKVEFSLYSSHDHTPDIYNNYTFSEHHKYFKQPFTGFAITFNVDILASPKCINSININPITC